MADFKSPYPGVDAHINTVLLQPNGGWEMFHTNFNVQMQFILDAALPDNYYAAAEKSLQISERQADDMRYPTRPDVSVYQLREGEGIAARQSAAPTAVMPLRDESEDTVDYLTSVGIYEIESGSAPGNLITQLELLSPANKPPRAYHPKYLLKREQTLNAGVNLIEIDLLHTMRPVLPRVPSYADADEGATPYYLLISQPDESDTGGTLELYAVGAIEPLPSIRVPLKGEDSIVLDVNSAYHQTIAGARVFRLLVDYTQPPVNITSFHDDDRTEIIGLFAK